MYLVVELWWRRLVLLVVLFCSGPLLNFGVDQILKCVESEILNNAQQNNAKQKADFFCKMEQERGGKEREGSSTYIHTRHM